MNYLNNKNLIFFFKIFFKIRKILNKNFYNILYSCGIDSNLSLFILINLLLKNILIITHINHYKKKIDKKYKKFFKKFFKKLNFKIFIINLKKNYKLKNISLELYLKNERDSFTNNLIKINNLKLLITSKNKNDVIEFYFIKLMLNSKNFIKNLNIKKKINLNIKDSFIINLSKNNIKKICLLNKNKWIEDRNNIKTKFKRNYIRIKFIKKNYKIKKINKLFKISRDVAEWFKALPC